MEFFVRYLLIFVSIPLLDAREFPCDFTHSSEAHGWLKLHETAATVASAMKQCKDEGAKLATPADVEMQHAMLMMMNQNIDAIHTGLPAIFNKTHGYGLRALQNDGTFKTVRPAESYPFFCFVADAEAECGGSDTEYQLDSRTGKCYKLHRVHATWPQARDACAEEGAHLAVLNNAAEAAALRDLFAKYPHDAIPGSGLKDAAFVGFTMKNNVWLTLFDQTLSEAGYEVWAPGEPNNARGDEFCGSFSRNGMFLDDPCSRGLTFFCERDAEALGCVDEQVSTQSPDEN